MKLAPGAASGSYLRRHAPRPAGSRPGRLAVTNTAAPDAPIAVNGLNGARVAAGGGQQPSTSYAAPAAPAPAPSAAAAGHYRPSFSTPELVDAGLKDDGGPLRFFSPVVRPTTPPSDPLPLLLYLPGIDGTGYAASRQFPLLGELFDVRALFTPAADRTPFEQQVALVSEFLEAELAGSPPERPVYLLGESYGAVLALATAAAAPARVDRLVLVNPATSFPRTPWPALGRTLGALPEGGAYDALPLALLPLLTNPLRMAAASVQIDPSRPLPEQLPGVANAMLASLAQVPALARVLPPATLAWKMELLEQGNAWLEGRLGDVQQRVLLLAADGDALIPSREEGRRLQRLLPRAALRELSGNGHAALQEAGVDLAAILQQQGFYAPRRETTTALRARRAGPGFGTPAPIDLPTPRELDKDTEGWLANIRRLTSPVFISTLPDGRRELGLGGVPQGRPVVFVGNHQLLAPDMYLFIERFVREQRRLPRGLAHPAVFGSAAAGAERGLGGFGSFLSTYGAVPVGGFNFHKLLAAGEDVLLFPGGAREAYHRKGEAYRLFWPDKPEFVRMAAKFGATLVPFGAVGAADSITLLADSRELLSLPLLGQRLQQQAARAPAARRGAAEWANDELFVPPLAAPGPPDRFYFFFGQPVATSPADLEDKARVAELYATVRGSVEGSISYLLAARERDPYRALLPRLLYEASWGRQAPTFDLTRDH